MLRAVLLYLSNATWLQRIVNNWSVAQRVSTRFIAGETLEQALQVVRRLNDKGLFTSLDHLGENVTQDNEADKACNEYIEIIQSIGDLQSNISIKLTQLGLDVDFDLCLNNVSSIAAKAVSSGMMVRIDMEDSSTIDRTIEIHRSLQDAGIHNVGLVFQAYLYRTEKDIQALLPTGVHVRLCKGAYDESPQIAFPKKADVDRNFDRLSNQLIDFAQQSAAEMLSSDGKIPTMVAIATHDEKRIEHAIARADEVGLPKQALEFQMLHGIRTDLCTRLAKEGYPVRVYVPFGTQWYPYFVRRLAERPANLWFFLSNLFRMKGHLS